MLDALHNCQMFQEVQTTSSRGTGTPAEPRKVRAVQVRHIRHNFNAEDVDVSHSIHVCAMAHFPVAQQLSL